MQRGFTIASSLSSLSELSSSPAAVRTSGMELNDESRNSGAASNLTEREQRELAAQEDERQRKLIIRGLRSSSTRSKLESLRRIMAMALNGDENIALQFFPEVVKIVADQSIELRRLAYVYLTRFASRQPDLILLAINCLQKDLMDPNQLVRGSALRCLAGIHVQPVSAVLLLSIKKCIRDTSPFVRKVAAHAIIQFNDNHPNDSAEELCRYIGKLLSDQSPLVLGSALMAFNRVCANRWDLLHANFRKFCRVLPDLDECSQVIAMRVLQRYIRQNFPNPNRQMNTDTSDNAASTNEFNHGDRRVFLEACESLLNSHDYAVVAQAISTMVSTGVTDERFGRSCILPLLRPIRWHGRLEWEQLVALRLIDRFIRQRPQLTQWFSKHFQAFFVHARDSEEDRGLKISILSRIAMERDVKRIFMDAQHHFHSTDPRIVCDMIRLVRCCAERFPRLAEDCLTVFLELAQSDEEIIVGSAIEAIRGLIAGDPQTHSHAIEAIAANYDNLSSPEARACIYWLLGQFCELVPSSVEPFLRRASESFSAESRAVKLQMLNMAVKVFLWDSQLCGDSANRVFDQANRDSDMDLRDRWRLFGGLLFGDENKPSTERSMPINEGRGLFNDLNFLSAIMFANRNNEEALLLPSFKASGGGNDEDASSEKEEEDLLTISAVLGIRLPGYQPIPPWTMEPCDPQLRAVEGGADGVSASPVASPTISPRQSLMRFPDLVASSDDRMIASDQSPLISPMESPIIPQPTLIKPENVPDLESFLNGSE